MRNPLMSIARRQGSPTAWQAMEEFRSEIDRWLEDRFPRFAPLPEGMDYSPSAGLHEGKNEYMLKVDLPGVGKDDVKIEVEGNRIGIRGERKEEREEREGKRYFSESYYGSFMRSFTLPEKIDESQVKASFRDGVLRVTIPRSGDRHTKSIQIQ